MDENITAKNFSRRFSGIQHTILRWNDKELDDGLFVNVFPINYELWVRLEGNFLLHKKWSSSNYGFSES